MKYISVLLVLVTFSLSAQTRMTNEEYIDKYYAIAVKKMVEFKIPASITLAQGILESGSGNSKLAQKANNHFGIKCHKEWQGKGYYMDDDAENECFRVYKNPEESYSDHSLFLTSRARYKFLFDELSVDDYKAWANGLKKAGYATNPKYPSLLISLIERYEMYKYDEIGLNAILKESNQNPVNEDNDMQDIEEEIPLPSLDPSDIISFNKTQAVKSNGRQLNDIAAAYDIPMIKLLKYNDADRKTRFTKEQYIYLKPKKKNGTVLKHHVKRGETMWEISQRYGIKLKALYKKNKMTGTQQAKPGEIIYLQGKRQTAPKIISYRNVMQEKQRIKEEQEAAEKAKIEAAQKAKEAAQRKAKEQLKRQQKEAAAKQAQRELEEREVAAQRELERQQAAYDKAKREAEEKAREYNQNDADSTVKAAPEEVEQETPYKETTAKTYTVKAGDTLYSISNKFYVTVEKLMELNNMSDTNLKIGQVLIVSP